MMTRKIIEQMHDELTLWLLLSKLKKAGFHTQRLKLQKLVYLIDVFGTLLNKKPTNYTFRAYKHGPYTKEIQIDVEHLVSKGIVFAEEKTYSWNPNCERSFEYTLGDYDKRVAEKVLNLVEFKPVEDSIEFVVQNVGYFSSNEIRNLVYAEPNYLEAKKKPFGSIINPEYNLAVKFKLMVRDLSIKELRFPLPDNQIPLLYLNFIKSLQNGDKPTFLVD